MIWIKHHVWQTLQIRRRLKVPVVQHCSLINNVFKNNLLALLSSVAQKEVLLAVDFRLDWCSYTGSSNGQKRCVTWALLAIKRTYAWRDCLKGFFYQLYSILYFCQPLVIICNKAPLLAKSNVPAKGLFKGCSWFDCSRSTIKLNRTCLQGPGCKNIPLHGFVCTCIIFWHPLVRLSRTYPQ